MVKAFCDRCGSEIYKHVYNSNGVRETLEHSVVTFGCTTDLCANCKRELEMWLKGTHKMVPNEQKDARAVLHKLKIDIINKYGTPNELGVRILPDDVEEIYNLVDSYFEEVREEKS